MTSEIYENMFISYNLQINNREQLCFLNQEESVSKE